MHTHSGAAEIKTKKNIEPKVLKEKPKQDKSIKSKTALAEVVKKEVTAAPKLAAKRIVIKGRQQMKQNIKEATGDRQAEHDSLRDLAAFQVAENIVKPKRGKTKSLVKRFAKHSRQAAKTAMARQQKKAKAQYYKGEMIRDARSNAGIYESKSFHSASKKIRQAGAAVKNGIAGAKGIAIKLLAGITLFLLLSIVLLIAGGSENSDAVASGSGVFTWPVPGHTRISSDYGFRICPFHGREQHSGIDIPAPYGTPVVAADSGVVISAGDLGSYGLAVLISHGEGTYTLYAHNSSILRRSGIVTKGTTIARVGSTGSSTGNHCHFEVRKGGSSHGNNVNPWAYLNKKASE